jgi:hypothetical protein
MIVFLGGLACALFTLLVGWCWPTNQSTNMVHAVLDGIGKSLWLGWALVVVAYFIGARGGTIVWLGLGLAAASAIVTNKGRSLQASRADFTALATIAALIVVFAIACFSFRLPYYSKIFHYWDALVSWNRWAIELQENAYRPVDAAYPILFPGLWSLVYRLQGNAEIWFLAKLSLFVLPGILLLVTYMLWSFGRPLAAGLCALAAACFSSRQLWWSAGASMLNGYMDGPVAVLMLVAAALSVLVIDAVDADDRAKASSLLQTMAIFTGVASVTKQAGTISLLAFSILLALLLTHQKITLRRTVALLAISALPLAAFLALFASVGGKLMGNLPYLSNLAEQRAGDTGLLQHAVHQLLRSGTGPIAILTVFAGLNLLQIGKLRGQFGFVLLALATAGFFTFAECCSYDERNGWWILSLLTGSAMLGSTGLFSPKKLLGEVRSVPGLPALALLVTAAVSVSAAAGAALSDASAKALQQREQWTLVSEKLANLVKPVISNLGADDIIVSKIRPLGWLPGAHGHFVLGQCLGECGKEDCSGTPASCIAARLSPDGRAFIVTGGPPFGYTELAPLFTTGPLVGNAGDFHVYGPYERGRFLRYRSGPPS